MLGMQRMGEGCCPRLHRYSLSSVAQTTVPEHERQKFRESVNNPDTMKLASPIGLAAVILGAIVTVVTGTLWPILVGLCIGVFCIYWEML